MNTVKTHDEIVKLAERHVVEVRNAANYLGGNLKDAAAAGHQSGYFKGYQDAMKEYCTPLLQEAVNKEAVNENFKTDNVGQIDFLKEQEKDIAFFMIVTDVERIRKNHGHYLWAFPVKWRNEQGGTDKVGFGYEIEWEDGKNSVVYGYGGEQLFDTYSEALKAGIEFINSLNKQQD